MGRAILCIALTVAFLAPLRADDNNKKDNDRVHYGRPILVAKGETVHGDVVCIACPVVNRGTIEGDAVVLMSPLQNYGSIQGDGTVVVGPLVNEGEISGDASVIVGPLNVAGTGIIDKDATVVMGPANISPGAIVRGTVEHHAVTMSALALLIFAPLTIGVVLAIVLALVCYLVAGQARITVVAQAIRARPGMSFVAGLIAVVVFVFALWAFAQMHPVSTVLVTAISIALTVAMIVGYTGLSFAIGNHLRSSSPVAAVVIGAIVIAVAQAIPFLQFFFGFVLLMFALGAAALTGFGTHPEWLERGLGPGPAAQR
jgi:hypothetical protein